MKKYRIFINGKNFLIEINGALAKHGFYTNRYVEANDERDAELQAMDMIRKREGLKNAVRNAEGDPPMMYAEEIHELNDFDEVESFEEGLAWYPEGGEAEDSASKEIYRAHIAKD